QPLAPRPCGRRDRPRPQRSPLSLHDALPIFAAIYVEILAKSLVDDDPNGRRDYWDYATALVARTMQQTATIDVRLARCLGDEDRSEEHTSELQSRENLVCRHLLGKKDHGAST